MTNSEQSDHVPLISEHDTWISVDPIIGCPANCKYCYLGPLGLRARKPIVRVEPHALVRALEDYLHAVSRGDRYGRLSRTPICFGNYTDTFMSGVGLSYFREYAKLHAARLGSHPLCVVTKARLSASDLALLDELGQTIAVFLSQSFLNQPGQPHVEVGPTSSPEDTIRNLSLFSGLQHVVPVHFLRPVTRRTVPDVAGAVRILSAVRSAGAIATVAVGLKLGPGVELSSQDIAAITGDSDPAVTSVPEFFPRGARLDLLRAARIVDYPLYFNTSCAVALVTKEAERLGTWRPPMRWSRCDPCNCPGPQRSRCDARRTVQVIPSDAEIGNLASQYGLPENSLAWIESESTIRLNCTVGQYTFNRLVHALPYRIVGRGVEPQEAWVGSFAREAELTVDDVVAERDLGSGAAPVDDVVWHDESMRAPSEMDGPVERLRSITGFVTTLHDRRDPRALVFGRYFHVRRVAWLADWLSSLNEGEGNRLNVQRVRWLAWAHDLNRWPFAHNSEKGNFDQAEDLPRYLKAHGLALSWEQLGYRDERSLVSDVYGIVSKQTVGVSAEAKTVLLADIIAGFVEDPLLAVAGLDMRLSMIPDAVSEQLALRVHDPDFRDILYSLNSRLYERHDVSGFMAEFDQLFRACAQSFVLKHSLTGPTVLERDSFNSLRALIKERFLRGILFPYNNEKVAHGAFLKSELIEPLLQVLGGDAVRVFTTVTEDELIKLALENDIIAVGKERLYFPDLDYIAAYEPGNSFRRAYGLS
jgi:DNA repair photolyase